MLDGEQSSQIGGGNAQRSSKKSRIDDETLLQKEMDVPLKSKRGERTAMTTGSQPSARAAEGDKVAKKSSACLIS